MGMDIVELIMRVEEDFEIGDDEASQCATAGQLSRLVMLKMGVSPSPDNVTKIGLASCFGSAPEQLHRPLSARQDEIWRRVQALIADTLSVPLEKVTPDADFVRDLGAD